MALYLKENLLSSRKHRCNLFPNFLGIGTPRSGTTWLHEMLAAHPRIYVPLQRKELCFFTKNYKKGWPWYLRYFPSDSELHKYIAVGEITPTYLYSENAAQRIANNTSINKLIIIFRHPVERLYSNYNWFKRLNNYKKNLITFIKEHPEHLERSLYAKWLKMYLDYFNLDNFLILIYEEAFKNLDNTKRKVCSFLGVSHDELPEHIGRSIINQGVFVKYPGLFHFASKMSLFLRNRQLDWIVNMAISLKIKTLLSQDTRQSQLDKNMRSDLIKIYIKDIEELASILRISLDAWKV